MKPSAIAALVVAAAVAGGAFTAHELTKPTDQPVRVNFVDPAADVATATPTVAPTPATVTTTTKAPVAVTSSSTTRKATVQKEVAVAQPEQSETSKSGRPIASSTATFQGLPLPTNSGRDPGMDYPSPSSKR